MLDSDEEVFRCSCGAELVTLWDYPEERNIYISAWEMGRYRGFALRHRLRHIWRIIRKGDPYEDEIVLTYEKARELGEWLAKR